MSVTRRAFLGRTAGLAGAAALGPLAGALPVFAAPQTGGRVKRVILIRFGGGVRLSETFGHANPTAVIPNLMQIAKKGVLYRNVRNLGRLDHLSATAQILTGNTYAPDQKLGKQLPQPTIFEYFRKKVMSGPETCLLLDPSWHSTHLAASGHADYGKGAAEILTRRNTVWHLQETQKPLKQTDAAWKEAEALKQVLLAEDFEHLSVQSTGGALDEPKLIDPEAAKVDQYRRNVFDAQKIPRKLGKGAVTSGDWVTAFYAERAFTDDKKVQPALMVLNFHGPDVAHQGSFSAYQDAVTQLDAVIGEFWGIHEKGNKLRNQTAIIITPDVGRDLSATGGGFPGHRSGDLGCRRLFALIVAPGVRPGVVDRVVRQTDLCPTMGAWLGVPTPHVEKDAKVLSEVA